MKSVTHTALAAAEKQLHELLNGGFNGAGLIPLHFKRTREASESALSLVRLALQEHPAPPNGDEGMAS